MCLLIACTAVNEYYNVTIKICIVITNFEKQKLLAKYNVLKPQTNKEIYHVKLLKYGIFIYFDFVLDIVSSVIAINVNENLTKPLVY